MKFLPGKGKLVICCRENKDAKKESGSELPWRNQNPCSLGENCKNFTLYHHLLRQRAVQGAEIYCGGGI